MDYTFPIASRKYWIYFHQPDIMSAILVLFLLMAISVYSNSTNPKEGYQMNDVLGWSLSKFGIMK